MSEKDEPVRPEARLPKGLFDTPANELRATADMLAKIRAVFERYGFEPLDTPAIDRENGEGFTADRLRYVHNRYLKAGVDITRERVLVYPVLHYRNGGLAIDDRAQTTRPALFAAGEIAGGVHGSNRLMGNSLLDTVVYGRRAGRCAAEVSR